MGNSGADFGEICPFLNNPFNFSSSSNDSPAIGKLQLYIYAFTPADRQGMLGVVDSQQLKSHKF